MSSVKKNSKIDGNNHKDGEQKQKLTIISLLIGVFLTVALIAFVTLLLIHLKVSTVDECHSHDCQNGTCVADQTRMRGYRCNCTLGYIGDNCQVDVCDNDDCQNGICVADQSKIRGYTCNCTTGFVGKNCQVDVCDKHDCQNGTCVSDQSWIRGYTCNCTIGFVGGNCQVDVCDNHDCQNGTCAADQSRIRGYTCNCTIGFVGENCQVDVCDNHDCQNGTCVADQSRIRGYTCNCTIGFDGENCQDEKLCGNCIEYVKNNSWILAFKAQSQTEINPVDVYKSVGIRHEVNGSYPLKCTALKQIPGCLMPYRTGLIDDWEEINVILVKFQVIIDETKTQEVVFDGRGSNNIDWFSAPRILSSTWQDVTSGGQFNFFTIEGHQGQSVNRQFYISREHAGCPNDKGWFASSFYPKGGCDWDKMGEKFPAFIVCPTATHCVMESEAVNAQAIAIWIKADN